jgi:hypothetical protein
MIATMAEHLSRFVLYGSLVSCAALVPLLALDLAEKGETVAGDVVFWLFFFSTVAVLAASLLALSTSVARSTGVRGLGYVGLAVAAWLLVNVVIL